MIDTAVVDFWDLITFPVRVLAWVVALPIEFFAWVIGGLKNYDPEKATCPGCGFKGDRGTGSRSCCIQCVPVAGSQQAMIKHRCFRCAAEFYSSTYTPAKLWLPSDPQPALRKEE